MSMASCLDCCSTTVNTFLFTNLFASLHSVGNRARMEEQQQRERQLFFRAHPYAGQIPGQVSEVG